MQSPNSINFQWVTSPVVAHGALRAERLCRQCLRLYLFRRIFQLKAMGRGLSFGRNHTIPMFTRKIPCSGRVTPLVAAIWCFVYYLLAVLCMLCVMFFVHNKMPVDHPPLPDLGHAILPRLQTERLGGGLLHALLCLTVISILLLTDKKTGLQWYIPAMFFMTYGTLYFLRIVTISVTSLPPTDNHCRDGYYPLDSFWLHMLQNLVSMGESYHCGDLLFSGHSVSITMCIIIFIKYFRRHFPIIVSCIVVLLGIVAYISIIAARSHYSVDVVLGIYLTLTTWVLNNSILDRYVELNDISD